MPPSKPIAIYVCVYSVHVLGVRQRGVCVCVCVCVSLCACVRACVCVCVLCTCVHTGIGLDIFTCTSYNTAILIFSVYAVHLC